MVGIPMVGWIFFQFFIDQVLDLLSGPVESCHSSLNYDEGKGIRSLILSAVGLQVRNVTLCFHENVFCHVKIDS